MNDNETDIEFAASGGALDVRIAEELVEQARAEGLALTGPDGLLAQCQPSVRGGAAWWIPERARTVHTGDMDEEKSADVDPKDETSEASPQTTNFIHFGSGDAVETSYDVVVAALEAAPYAAAGGAAAVAAVREAGKTVRTAMQEKTKRMAIEAGQDGGPEPVAADTDGARG